MEGLSQVAPRPQGFTFRYVQSHFIIFNADRKIALYLTTLNRKPENDRIVVSNRGDATFGKNGDSFAVFTCITGHGNHANDFSFVGLFPAYGSFPREFEINGHNGVITVALQNSHEVALVQWDKQTRRPGKLLAKKSLDGEIPAAIWGP